MPPNPDILIIGAGFSGLYALHTLRTALPSLTTHSLEAAPDIGGVWHWNRYPGARVDSEWPFYQLTIPSVFRDLYFTERFPDHVELRRYFAHLDEVLDLKRDITFNARVNSAVWDEQEQRWVVKTENGIQVHATYLILGSGLLHKPYIPSFKGVERFLVMEHPSTTPAPGSYLDPRERKDVIGAGATGVQIVQDASKSAAQLTLYLRRPSACLPMRNRVLTREEQDSWRPFYPALFDASRRSRTGIPFALPPSSSSLPSSTFSDSQGGESSHQHQQYQSIFTMNPTDLESYSTHLWTSGSFNFGARNFPEVNISPDANRLAYDFWARKTRSTLRDAVKRDAVAPLEQADYLFTRRMPLEEDFYGCVDRENVDVVLLRFGDGGGGEREVRFTERGGIVVDGDGDGDEEMMFDIVVLATRFDAFSGGLSNMNIHGLHNTTLTETWQSGIKAYLGITMHGFPNCFMSYTPHAPTPLSNAPTIIQIQINLITTLLTTITSPSFSSSTPSPADLSSKGKRNPIIEPTLPAQTAWIEMIQSHANGTLYEKTDSWWNGANVPGKKREVVTFLEGVGKYERVCREKVESLEGFGVWFLDGYKKEHSGQSSEERAEENREQQDALEMTHQSVGMNGSARKDKRASFYSLPAPLRHLSRS